MYILKIKKHIVDFILTEFIDGVIDKYIDIIVDFVTIRWTLPFKK